MRAIITIVKERRWRWLGRVIRKDSSSITHVALHWMPDDRKRKQGRPVDMETDYGQRD